MLLWLHLLWFHLLFDKVQRDTRSRWLLILSWSHPTGYPRIHPCRGPNFSSQFLEVKQKIGNIMMCCHILHQPCTLLMLLVCVYIGNIAHSFEYTPLSKADRIHFRSLQHHPRMFSPEIKRNRTDIFWNQLFNKAFKICKRALDASSCSGKKYVQWEYLKTSIIPDWAGFFFGLWITDFRSLSWLCKHLKKEKNTIYIWESWENA